MRSEELHRSNKEGRRFAEPEQNTHITQNVRGEGKESIFFGTVRCI